MSKVKRLCLVCKSEILVKESDLKRGWGVDVVYPKSVEELIEIE